MKILMCITIILFSLSCFAQTVQTPQLQQVVNVAQKKLTPSINKLSATMANNEVVKISTMETNMKTLTALNKPLNLQVMATRASDKASLTTKKSLETKRLTIERSTQEKKLKPTITLAKQED